MDPTERAVRLRVALGELHGNAAELPALELSRADAWLARAEALTRVGADPSLRDLLLETTEGQLALLRSQLALGRSRRTLRAQAGSSSPPVRAPEWGDGGADAQSDGGPP